MSWLKPYLRTWYAVYPNSVPPIGQLAHYVEALLKAHPEERIVRELAAYLRVTHPHFLSVPKFAMAFGSWSRPEPRRPYSQTVDEMDKNALIPVRKP